MLMRLWGIAAAGKWYIEIMIVAAL